MAVLSEILALLDKWPLWKRLKEAPDRLDELEQRLAALEVAPRKAPGKPCKACGEPAMRLTSSEPDPIMGDLGAKRETWTCGACAFAEDIVSR